MTGMYELLESIEDVIKSANAEQRSALAESIDAYEADFPEEYSWAIGAQAPVLLHHLLTSIDMACRSDDHTEKQSASFLSDTPEPLRCACCNGPALPYVLKAGCTDVRESEVEKAHGKSQKCSTKTFWLSFADETGFLGVAIVDSDTFLNAVMKTYELGINPGGSVAWSDPPQGVLDIHKNRLLSRDELDRLFVSGLLAPWR